MTYFIIKKLPSEVLGRAVSTITREFGRHGCVERGYRAAAAHKQSKERRAVAKVGVRKLGMCFDTPLGKGVHQDLLRALSPEQIAGRRKLMYPEQPEQQISHESIYRAIYVMPRGELRTQIISALRQSRQKRMPRARGVARKSNIANLVPLSQRPAEADSREVPGHWEGISSRVRAMPALSALRSSAPAVLCCSRR